MARQGLVFRADSVRAGLFDPVLIEGVSIRESDRRSGGLLVHLERMELVWSGPGRVFSGWRNWVQSVSLEGMNVVLDLRHPDSPASRGEPGLMSAAGVLGLLAPGGAWPSSMQIRNGSAEVLGENFRHVFDGLDLSLNSEAHGRFRLESLTVQAGKFNKVFGPFTAPTTWEQGNAGLAGLDLLPGVGISDLALRLDAVSGPSMSFSARVFGGALRGDVNLSNGPRGKVWDVAAFGSNIAVDDIPALLDLSGKAKGTLAEGRFTFRGDAERPADAEASLRVLAKDFRWNDRGWESLEIGASLIHRRLLISNFDLRQKENKVTMNGEISLAEGWSKISESPFLANVRANIQELDSLAGLLGGSLGKTSGQLTAEGSVSGRPGSLDGFLGIRANGIVVHSVPVERMNLEVLFRKKQVELVRCEMLSGKDALNAKGTVELAAPHAYSAELNASLAEVATYLRPFYAKGGGAVSGGAMGIRWKGRGSVAAHSGEFDVDLSKFVSAYTPAGLTGHFVGVYSPESLYFSELDLENGSSKLQTRATFTSTGLTLEGLELTGASKPLLSGSVFLPVDALSILHGADWKTAVMQSGDMYLRANTPRELELRDLLRLAGQDWPLSGFVKMQVEASGPPSKPDFNALIKGRDVAFGGANVPASAVEVDLKTSAGSATLSGKVESAGMAPLVLKASFPLGLSQAEDGSLRWFNADAPFQADIESPRLDLALARPILPFLQNLRGEISGFAKIGNSAGSLKISGEAEVRSTSFGFNGLASGVERLHGKVAVVDGALLFENIEGEVGQGRFAMDGRCEFPQAWKPKWNLRWRTDRVPLASHPALTLLATGELAAVGDEQGGALTGDIGFQGSLIHGAFSLRPLLSQKTASVPDFPAAAHILSKLAPSADWLLDVKIDGGEGLEVRGEKFSAFLTPDLRLIGTVGHPLPVGHVKLTGVDAGGFFIESGGLFFLQDQPWNPFLLVEGEGWFAGLFIHAFAFGPLSEGKWILSSGDDSQQTPLDLFLAVAKGWTPLVLEGEGPVDMRIYRDADGSSPRVVSSRIEEDSLWSNGTEFGDSMDFSPGAAIFPIDSFRSGFEWRLVPFF